MTTDEKIDIILRQLAEDKVMINALNAAVIGVAYAAGIKGDELDKLPLDDYKSFIKNHVQPLVDRVDDLLEEDVKAEKKRQEKEAKKAKKAAKKGKK